MTNPSWPKSFGLAVLSMLAALLIIAGMVALVITHPFIFWGIWIALVFLFCVIYIADDIHSGR